MKILNGSSGCNWINWNRIIVDSRFVVVCWFGIDSCDKILKWFWHWHLIRARWEDEQYFRSPFHMQCGEVFSHYFPSEELWSWIDLSEEKWEPEIQQLLIQGFKLRYWFDFSDENWEFEIQQFMIYKQKWYSWIKSARKIVNLKYHNCWISQRNEYLQ